jgi:hypothetical protein
MRDQNKKRAIMKHSIKEETLPLLKQHKTTTKWYFKWYSKTKNKKTKWNKRIYNQHDDHIDVQT